MINKCIFGTSKFQLRIWSIGENAYKNIWANYFFLPGFGCVMTFALSWRVKSVHSLRHMTFASIDESSFLLTLAPVSVSQSDALTRASLCYTFWRVTFFTYNWRKKVTFAFNFDILLTRYRLHQLMRHQFSNYFLIVKLNDFQLIRWKMWRFHLDSMLFRPLWILLTMILLIPIDYSFSTENPLPRSQFSSIIELL